MLLLLQPERANTPLILERDKLILEQSPKAQIALGRMPSGAGMVGSTAVIPVNGIIDYRRSILSDVGMVASSEVIRQDFQQLLADDSVSQIVFDIDSPGGLYSGLPELARDVFDARGTKSTIAVANPMAASGALWLGAAADKFYTLQSGLVGSLGALMLHQDASEMFAANGITNTILRSPEGKADFTSMEPLTDESREHHQQQVEAIAEEFLAFMAKARGVSKGDARQNFGQGRMLDGRAAARAGLVDGIVPSLGSVLGPKRPKRRLSPRLQIAKLKGERLRAEDAQRLEMWES